MLDRLINTLVASRNGAADDVLLEALRLGVEREQRRVLSALLRRRTVRGLSGVVALYDRLPEPLQLHVLRNVKLLYAALRECGRSDDLSLRLAAMKLVALGRQGRMAYVLSENLHHSTETASKAATEAVVALARWVSTETRRLQSGAPITWKSSEGTEEDETDADAAQPPEESNTYLDLLDQRPEIEAAVARAMDVHRGRHGQDLL